MGWILIITLMVWSLWNLPDAILGFAAWLYVDVKEEMQGEYHTTWLDRIAHWVFVVLGVFILLCFWKLLADRYPSIYWPSWLFDWVIPPVHH
jgi:hypothetical protein